MVEKNCRDDKVTEDGKNFDTSDAAVELIVALLVSKSDCPNGELKVIWRLPGILEAVGEVVGLRVGAFVGDFDKTQVAPF